MPDHTAARQLHASLLLHSAALSTRAGGRSLTGCYRRGPRPSCSEGCSYKIEDTRKVAKNTAAVQLRGSSAGSHITDRCREALAQRPRGWHVAFHLQLKNGSLVSPITRLQWCRTWSFRAQLNSRMAKRTHH